MPNVMMQIASLVMKTAFWRPVIWPNGRPVLRALGEGTLLGVSMQPPYSSRLSVPLRLPCSLLTPGSIIVRLQPLMLIVAGALDVRLRCGENDVDELQEDLFRD